jgi:hypothetical protein
MTFAKGQSGNPAGRPRGSRNRSTLLEQALHDGEGEAIMRALIHKALGGDMAALRLCVERVVPRLPDEQSRIPFELRRLGSAGDLVPALLRIMDAVAGGKLSAKEVAAVANLLHRLTGVLPAADFEARLRKLEMASLAESASAS